VIIDFAHTPDALAKALGSLRQHITSQGQLWCVFGCGGDRDKGKRAQMGEVAEHYADKLVLTADNPRSENNAQIVADILQGIKVQEQVYIEHDRTAAIHYALEQASEADLILVAGKGHESYQEVAGIKHDFSDQQVVNEYIAAANDRINMMRAAS
jgi:UDP-N-acetylmuramoyl-L-alanyl-D-glutamate--2,6-diaminopimelate ligase